MWAKPQFLRFNCQHLFISIPWGLFASLRMNTKKSKIIWIGRIRVHSFGNLFVDLSKMSPVNYEKVFEGQDTLRHPVNTKIDQ